MEKRAILAAVLMAGVFIVYQMFFFPEPPPPQKPPAQTASQPPASPASAPAPTPATAPVTPAAPARSAPAPRPQHVATVEAPLYRDVVSSEGGKLQELVLRYRGEKPMVIVGDLGPGGLQLAPDGNSPGQVISMSLDKNSVVVTDKPAELVLTADTDGLKIRETLKFQPDGYAIEAHVRIENPGAAPRTVALSLPWFTRQTWRGTPEKFQGQHPTEIVWFSQGSVNRIDDLGPAHSVVTDGDWVAFDSLLYISALVPKGPGFKLVASTEGKVPDAKSGDTSPAGRATVAVQATPTIGPGQAWEGTVVLYAGPKEYDRLKALGLQETINFGGFPLPRKYGGLPMEWLGVPILLLLNWTYKHVGNYGVAIILLTVVSKVLFYPLTVKSMRSMKAMQALQPQVNALRSKYQKDPQTLQRETLALYKKHRVNPMGGCLPMIAQVPIFYALYLALQGSVELQGSPFLCFGRLIWFDLWICDLAAHDPIYVLPVLMGITMFVQQKMTPTMGDPRQAKMMLFMPFIFTFMFLNLPSGLVLYWTVSNILQILQQKLMATREAKDAGRA